MLVKKNWEKNLKSTIKVHPRLYKMKQKETKQCVTLERKNTLPINKAKGDRLWRVLLSWKIIL